MDSRQMIQSSWQFGLKKEWSDGMLMASYKWGIAILHSFQENNRKKEKKKMKEKSLDNIVGARKNSRDREVESMDMWSGLHL